jgi:hypothetical protein
MRRVAERQVFDEVPMPRHDHVLDVRRVAEVKAPHER